MSELEIVRHAQIDGLSMFFNTVEYRTPHLHPEWELILVLEQPLLIACGQEQFSVEPGQIILFNPGQPHEVLRQEKSCTFLCMQIAASALPQITPLYVDTNLLHTCLDAKQMEETRRVLWEIMDAYLKREPNSSLYCIGKSCLLLHSLFS